MGVSLKMDFPSDPQLLCVVRSAVRQWCELAGCADEECRALTLAVDEALTNVIRHAYQSRTDQPIEVTFHRNEERLEFVIVDHGRPVEPEKIRGRPLGEVRPGGLGTHFIAQIMDRVDYEPLPGSNRARLVKYRARAK
jgi:anti-sigma regulatory factor (Ser/Thr protein kinase)